jgi:isocitrate dehydrogenase kinase/phosphatase
VTDETSAPESVAVQSARFLAAAFVDYNNEFRAITRRAPHRFEARDWRGSQNDAVERIELYDHVVNATVAELRLRLGAQALDRELWREIRRHYAEIVEPLPDTEFNKTFFSSITRRLFGTIGVAPDLEFVALDLDPLGSITTQVVTNVYANRGSLRLLFEQVLTDFRFQIPWKDFDRSVAYVTSEVHRYCEQMGERRAVQQVEIIRPVFYQMTRAYLVGRVQGRGWMLPLVIALKDTDRGVLVDAVMMREEDVTILFSFTRSYFHVDLERVGEAVLFLKSILPRKPVSELFTVLGRDKQGKTERYRELFRHLQHSTDQFVHAPGDRGLVMICFTLPSFDVVFKVIRDEFPPPKTILRQEVLAKYELVFKHDRAGRLVDAQEFRSLRLPKGRFAPELLEELMREASSTVHSEGDDLIFDHMYIERRMTPLNLFVQNQSGELTEKILIDYGQAIRDLAYTNIFAGDLLLKNFGVTRYARVIFYDYDDLCRVTDCHFRDLPQATNEEDELRGEAWYYVADNDVFPETFMAFLGLSEPLKKVLLDAHGEIFTAAFWRQVQQHHRDGEVLEVLPYHPHRVRVASSY